MTGRSARTPPPLYLVTFCPLHPPGSQNSVATQGFSYRALMELLRRLVLGSLMVAGTTGLGVGVWALATPREERRREIAKELPETNPLRWAERRHQNELVMAAIKEAAETNENVARRSSSDWSK
ncbi:ubiquinol-cytochrome-c reductase complex assembly factor 3-like [Emys orbicularis]|uniref:ubiquinol-cytochrome-c reductase complex assembly factor 3-like n=1 Tax=Emys orbicularis TaxID=82168 RepID=UPI0031FBE613